ncbi:MAG: hypothetical protein P9M14_02665 [Candidatus Alcyoniella australis]|nr:hypothetical protein [Candidatus Alcyoniella australis]
MKLNWILLALALLLTVALLGGCPDEEVESECEWDGDCGNNTAPRLYGLVFSVNGGQATSETPQIGSTDTILIACSYEDDEGNLTGGMIFFSDENGDSTSTSDINVELGCSTSDTGIQFGIQLSGSETPLNVGYHNFEMYWTDVCGFSSNKLEGTFYVE